MRLKPLVFVILLVLSSPLSYADTFIVTSNADSGPGTLREAIDNANANGSAVTDYIYFNIAQPVFNLRIIDVVTELPALSSNLIIDGTTQPGAAYGTTEAKICVRKLTYAPIFSMLKIENAQHVQIYGMLLYYGYWQGLFTTPARSWQLYGINITKSSDIVIGGPGKGNVITGAEHGIYSYSDGCANVTIRSNYLAHSAFYSSGDVDSPVLMSECAITLGNVKDIFIGGPQPADGNIFGGGKGAINIDSKNATGNGLIRIQHNLFARKYDKVTIIPTYDFWDSDINIGRSSNNPVNWTLSHNADYQVELLDNDIPSDVAIGYTSDSLIVLRNKFLYDGRTHGGKLDIFQVGPGLIGGDDPANANVFMNKKFGFAQASINIAEAGAITVLKNIFTCNSTLGSTLSVYNSANKVPFAQVDITTPAGVTGRATPNARVDLYYDDECTACEGKAFIATLQADAAGNWTYAGLITGTVIATATKNGYTSQFSFPMFDHTNKKVVQPSCGLKNGSITGIIPEGAEAWFWINYRTGDTASKTIDLLNAGPGEYGLYGVHGGTCIYPMSQSITLDDVTPVIIFPPGNIKQPACGLSNGAITGMRLGYIQHSKLEWKNESGQVVSNQVDLYNLPPGKYTFYATDLNAGCTAVSPTYELINQSGASLNTGAVQIVPTTCGKANGSITGITAANVTGTPFIQWVDALNKTVGNGYDLLNVPSGTYRFKFKDQGSCDTSIRTFTINAQTTFSPITVTGFTTKDGTCDQAAASINIQAFSVSPAGYTFKWVNAASGAAVGNGVAVSSLPGGTYQLFATDINNCEEKIFTTTVKVLPKPSFDYSSVSISNDQCDLHEGAITSLKINGLITPATYSWFDENGSQVGNTASLQKMPAGTYYLQVTDGGACTVKSNPFTILNTNPALPAPTYTDLTISRHSDATLTVKNPSPGDYKLFTDASGAALSQQNATGNFTLAAVPSDITVYIQQERGSCKSQLVPVSIKVVDRSYFTISNAFTPNRDGKNDQLSLRVKGYIDVNYFRIYNRWGQMIYETKKLNDGWDGRWNGVLQPAGTYVWIAEGKDLLGNTIYDKGSFVLIL